MSSNRTSTGRSTPSSRRKPTIWQTILNKPSRSYHFAHQPRTDRHSMRASLVRAAQEGSMDPEHAALTPLAISTPTTPVSYSNSDDTSRNNQEIQNNPSDTESEGSTRSSSDDSNDNGTEIFFTPATTPRHSVVRSETVAVKDLNINQVVISPIKALKSDNTLLPPASSMTTSPTTSQDSLLASSRSPVTSSSSLPPKAAGSYTDEDWRRDSESTKTYKPPLSRMVSHPPVTSAPSSRRMQGSWRSSSSSLNRMPNMAAVLEEDETPGATPKPPPLPPRGSVVQPIMTTEMDNPQFRGAWALALSNDGPRSATLPRAASEPDRKRRVSLPPLSRTASVTSDSSNTGSYRSKKSSPLSSSTSAIIPPPPQNASESLPSRATQHYTSLTLPVASYDPISSPKFVDTVDLTRSGDAQTTIATVETVSGLASASVSSFLNLRRSTPKIPSEPTLAFVHHRKPPSQVPPSGLIVQVWAVGLDRLDVHLLHGKSAGYIPGRSFLGRVYQSGYEVQDRVAKRGDWIVGLLDIRQVSY
jgi:hypothetical protein